MKSSFFRLLASLLMDFARFDYKLNRIASWHRLPMQKVLEERRERRESSDPESWRQLDGIPCIMGGLTALCSMFYCQAFWRISENVTGRLDGRGVNFPWKTLPTLLGKHGFILHNYPENTLMPGERCNTLRKSKGIHNLTLHECGVLVDALKDDMMTLQHLTTDDACQRLLASCDPVIYSKAPGPDSHCTHGRRQFVDSHIDQNGHRCLRLHNTSPAPSRPWPHPCPCPGPSCHHITLHETSPVPYYPVPSRCRKIHMFLSLHPPGGCLPQQTI